MGFGRRLESDYVPDAVRPPDFVRYRQSPSLPLAAPSTA
jgi:hypothetical protein